MRVNTRMTREMLERVFCNMASAGYDLSVFVDQLHLYTKADLVFFINNAERPIRVFGHDINRIQIRKEDWQWRVFDPSGKPLLLISFTQAFEWSDVPNSYTPAFFAVLEACLVEAPLSRDDLARLESKRPGLTSKPLFPVDHDAWEVDDEPEPEPEITPPPRRAPKAVEPEVRPLSPKRKIRL